MDPILYFVGMKQSFRSNKNVVYSREYHVVFCPKYRRTVLVGPIADRLKAILHEVATETGNEILELEIMPDHVHILCEVDPQFGIATFLRRCNRRSSRLLRQEFSTLKSRLPTLWTNSTFISTVDGAPLAVVKQYIEEQKNR